MNGWGSIIRPSSAEFASRQKHGFLWRDFGPRGGPANELLERLTRYRLRLDPATTGDNLPETADVSTKLLRLVVTGELKSGKRIGGFPTPFRLVESGATHRTSVRGVVRHPVDTSAGCLR